MIERKIDPGIWTDRNIDQMRDQLGRLGLSIDWTREQATGEDYYRWTQCCSCSCTQLTWPIEGSGQRPVDQTS